MDQIEVRKVDVVIAGSGGAGMRAAIEAQERGCSVVMLAKGPARANHTRMAGGRFNAVSGMNTKDSVQAFYQDTLDSGAGMCRPVMARVLAEEAMDRALDLEFYGLTWDRTEDQRYFVSMTGGGSFMRTLGSRDEGIGITEVMLQQLYARRIPVQEFHMLVDVLRGEDGAVEGCLVLDIKCGKWIAYQCSVAIIATGGTSQLYQTNSGPAINTGDGIAIALRAGATLVDMEFMQFIPISFVYPPSIRGYTLLEPAHYGKRHVNPNAEAGILLNTRGERFVLKHDPVRREGSTRDVLARAIMLEILEGRGTPEGGVLMMPDPDVLEDFIKERPIYSKRLLENYGEAQARFQAPIQVVPSALYTLGGVYVNEDCQTSVPGLLAAGEAAGGVHGANRLGGSSMPDIQVFGRRAGISAVARVHERRGGRIPAFSQSQAASLARAKERWLGQTGGVRPVEVKRNFQKLMSDHVGLVRSGPKLSETLRTFKDLNDQVLPGLSVQGKSRVLNRDWMEAIELENMLSVAQTMATASLMREESRGAHFRTDFPDTNPDWRVNILVSQNGSRLKVERNDMAEVVA